MKSIDEALKPQTIEDLRGVYRVDTNDNCLCVLPSEEKTLTADNFRLLTGNGVLTINDFRWYREDGLDRDFTFGNGFDYFDKEEIPSEVFSLLTTVIVIKFAARHLADAKAKLEQIDNDKLKQSINTVLTTFNSLDDATEWEKKLQIAHDSFIEVSVAFDNIDEDLCDLFDHAATVIGEVLEELIDLS